MERGYDIKQILDFLNPSELNYQEWIYVGIALKGRLRCICMGFMEPLRQQIPFR